MLATLVLAATLPLGVWPVDAGPAASVVDDIEVYLVEPEDDYFILAVEPLSPPLAKADPAPLKRLAALAHKLGADGVILLAELAEKEIPEDPGEPLPQGRTFTAAVFVTFDVGADADDAPTFTRASGEVGRQPRGAPRHAVHRVAHRPAPTGPVH